MFDSKGRNIHYLRLSVTDLCNLRCRYCMPDGVDKLEREDILTYEEFLRLAALFARCGVDTVRVTGGEPLVRKGVEQLVKGLKAIPGIRKVTMTTNAVLLEQQLPALLEAGLDSVNISLDTLDPALFAKITARDEFAAVQAGIHAALESGIPVKLNCVPQVGVNEGELEALAALAQDKPLQVRFIEMMPIGYGAAMPCISGPELLARFRRRWPELAPLPGAACAALGDGPAVYYTVPDWKGDIGFIAAVHGKFCASCNRVRYFKLNKKASEKKLTNYCDHHENITSIQYVSGISEGFYSQMESLDSVVFILIVCAGALAFIVLYNLTNINIQERKSEIATIKVLGFYPKEVYDYVFRENIILAFIGSIVGLGLGKIIHAYLIRTVEVDMAMFIRTVNIRCYMIAIILTMAFTFLINLYMRRVLKKIDMVESLKSIE